MELGQYYENQYKQVMSSGTNKLVWKMIFQKMSKSVSATKESIILELGSGNGEFQSIVNLPYRVYLETDLWKTKQRNQPLRPADLEGHGIISRILDAQNLEAVPDESVDILIATCLLVHLNEPKMALQEWNRILRPNGQAIFYVPCEPGIFLRLARHFTTRRKLAKVGIRQSELHWHEHIQHFLRAKFLIEQQFTNGELKFRYYPFLLPSWNLNLFALVIFKKKGN